MRSASALLAAFLAVSAALTPGPVRAAGESSASLASGVADSRSTDNLDPALLAEMRRQEALNPAVDLLYDEIGRLSASGFTSMSFEDGGLSVYWRGDVPAVIQAAVRAAAKFGTVRTRPARYSKAELDAAITRVSAATGLGSDIQSVFARPDGSGLEVQRMPATAMAARQAALGGRAPKRVESILATMGLDVPVAVTVATAGVTRAACAGACTRENDQAAWNGGTHLRIPLSATRVNNCTSGFGVRKGSQTYLITASHCANPSNKFYDAAGEFIGGVYDDDWGYDLMLINARGYGRIFDGAPGTSYSKPVRSAGNPVSHEYLCQSGYRSGTVCDIETLGSWGNLWGCDSDGDCFYTYDMYWAVQVDGLPSCQGGDSGAPVFSLDGTGVRVKGVTVAKGGDNGELFFYQDWPTITSTFGVTPVLG
ncbi:hypothetical protein Cme02nite_73350 [Catellatospora methionotrophica]|uniref:Uncharacterized protein n=2 Tax=Catellatospora methionotrophica TaxID=121620 RepID=A0A8J3LIL9_9ACTN|nr:hypothetical protein Cme02nite_73350 [Catellatospora methionotrophica]